MLGEAILRGTPIERRPATQQRLAAKGRHKPIILAQLNRPASTSTRRTRQKDKKVRRGAGASCQNVATELSHRINGFEGQWFFRTMRDRDAGKLGPITRERTEKYNQLTLADYRADLKERWPAFALFMAN